MRELAWKELIEKARAGDRDAAWLLWTYLELRARRAITARLWLAGVPQEDLDDAFKDVLIRLVLSIHRLKDVFAFWRYLRWIEQDVARRYRPARVQRAKGPSIRRQAPGRPSEIARKSVTVDGKQYIAKVFEPAFRLEEPVRRPFRDVELTDSNVYEQSKTNFQQGVESIDGEKLLSQLSPELRRVMRLRFFDNLRYQEIENKLGYQPWKTKRLISEGLCSLRKLCGVELFKIAPGYEIRYLPQFVESAQADEWLSRLLAEVPFQPEQLELYGQRFVLKRQTAQYGTDYRYNSAAQESRAWPPFLNELKVLVQRATGLEFNSALCNLYPNGQAYIGPHHDAEHPEMIASLSFGGVRELRFAESSSLLPVFDMELAHGSLLLIPKSVNEHFKHMVPKSAQVREPRVNVTFRKFRVA